MKFIISGIILIIQGICILEGAQVDFFTKPYTARSNYKDKALSTNNLEVLEIYAAKGEYEPVVLHLRSSQIDENMSVRLAGDLKNGKSVIKKDNIDIRIAEDCWHWLDTRSYARYPYLLSKDKEFTLLPDQTQQIWLTVKVSEDAEPGLYISNVEIRQKEKLIKKIRFEVNVWPFVLKKVKADEMMYFMYHVPSGLPESWGWKSDYLAKCYTDMKEHGMNTVMGSVYMEVHGDIMTSTQKGKWPSLKEELDAIDTSGILKDNGVFILGTAKMYATSPKLQNITEIMRGKGYGVKFYGIDEPGMAKYRQDLTRDFMPKIKNAVPSVPIVTAICKIGVETVGDYYDGWIYLAYEITDKTREDASAKKKILYSYDCGLAAIDPLTSRFYWGFFPWRAGAKGASQWAYCHGSLFDRFDYKKEFTGKYDPMMDPSYNFVFLSPDGPEPTIAWEAIREGIDDFRYISQLQDLIAKAKKQGKIIPAQEAEKLLSELYGKINLENFAIAKKEGEKFQGRRGYAYNRLSPEPALSPEDYDKYRRKIARSIVNLIKLTE